MEHDIVPLTAREVVKGNKLFIGLLMLVHGFLSSSHRFSYQPLSNEHHREADEILSRQHRLHPGESA